MNERINLIRVTWKYNNKCVIDLENYNIYKMTKIEIINKILGQREYD